MFRKILTVSILLSYAERGAVVFCSDAYLKDTSVFPSLNEFICLHSYCFMGEFHGCSYNIRRLLASWWSGVVKENVSNNTKSNFKIGVLGPCLFKSIRLCVI